MRQENLFHERIEDAIAAVADALGRKRVAAQLWPDKTERDAHNLLDACLNTERKERFAPSQLLFIARLGRDAGYHAIAAFMARDLGYADPVPIEPRDEAAELQRQYIEAARGMRAMAERIERLTNAPAASSSSSPVLRGVTS